MLNRSFVWQCFVTIKRNRWHVDKKFVSNILFAVDKNKINLTKTFENELQPLKNNEIRLKVEKFALTSNTITYGKIGTKFGYYDFYPLSSSSHWGCVPAIGWASVVESNMAGISCGGQYFGWYPMSKYCTIEASPSRTGFSDVGKHRKLNAQVYKDHIRTDLDPFRDSALAIENACDYDDRQAILRGLFLTSFLADEYLMDEEKYYGAKHVIIVSASSKTALGIAQRLAMKNKTKNVSDKHNIIGVTSEGNASFVKETGYYHQTITYDAIGTLSTSGDSVVVIDMSGNWRVIKDIHEQVGGEHVKHSMAIGMSHHDSEVAPKTSSIPGPQPALFFAPAEVTRRLREWGPDAFHCHAKDALTSFVNGSRTWMEVEHVYGLSSMKDCWLKVYNGKVAPNIGLIASLHE